MSRQNEEILLVKIEELRKEMHRLSTEKKLSNPKLIQVSQQLDRLLNEYEQVKKNKP